MHAPLVLSLLLVVLTTASAVGPRERLTTFVEKFGLTDFAEKTDFVERALSSPQKWSLMGFADILGSCLADYQDQVSSKTYYLTLIVLTDEMFINKLDQLAHDLNTAKEL